MFSPSSINCLELLIPFVCGWGAPMIYFIYSFCFGFTGLPFYLFLHLKQVLKQAVAFTPRHNGTKVADSGLCIYHFSLWSELSRLHSIFEITFPHSVMSALALLGQCAYVGDSLDSSLWLCFISSLRFFI